MFGLNFLPFCVIELGRLRTNDLWLAIRFGLLFSPFHEYFFVAADCHDQSVRCSTPESAIGKRLLTKGEPFIVRAVCFVLMRRGLTTRDIPSAGSKARKSFDRLKITAWGNCLSVVAVFNSQPRILLGRSKIAPLHHFSRPVLERDSPQSHACLFPYKVLHLSIVKFSSYLMAYCQAGDSFTCFSRIMLRSNLNECATVSAKVSLKDFRNFGVW